MSYDYLNIICLYFYLCVCVSCVALIRMHCCCCCCCCCYCTSLPMLLPLLTEAACYRWTLPAFLFFSPYIFSQHFLSLNILLRTMCRQQSLLLFFFSIKSIHNGCLYIWFFIVWTRFKPFVFGTAVQKGFANKNKNSHAFKNWMFNFSSTANEQHTKNKTIKKIEKVKKNQRHSIKKDLPWQYNKQITF